MVAFSVLSNGAEAISQVAKLAPDIVLMDLNMPGMDGVQVTETLHQQSPQTKVLVLSMYGNREYIMPVIKAGARGYVLKDAAPDELVRSVRTEELELQLARAVRAAEKHMKRVLGKIWIAALPARMRNPQSSWNPSLLSGLINSSDAGRSHAGPVPAGFT